MTTNIDDKYINTKTENFVLYGGIARLNLVERNVWQDAIICNATGMAGQDLACNKFECKPVSDLGKKREIGIQSAPNLQNGTWRRRRYMV